MTEADRIDADLDEVRVETWISPSGKSRTSSNIFLATGCEGEYRVDITMDGRNYQNVPVLDLQNRQPRETFRLRPSCVRPVTFIFIP